MIKSLSIISYLLQIVKIVGNTVRLFLMVCNFRRFHMLLIFLTNLALNLIIWIDHIPHYPRSRSHSYSKSVSNSRSRSKSPQEFVFKLKTPVHRFCKDQRFKKEESRSPGPAYYHPKHNSISKKSWPKFYHNSISKTNLCFK